MPAIPPKTVSLGLPRFDRADSTELWVHLNALADGIDQQFGSWQSYRPVWSQSDGKRLAVGSGSITGRYCVTGKTVDAMIILNWKRSNRGSKPWVFSLPVPARAWREVGGTIACVRGGRHYAGVVFPVGTGAVGAIIGNAGRVSNTVPSSTFANGDWYQLTLRYEVA